MKCPECGSICWRNEVDVGVGIYHDAWKCDDCGWDEDCAFPMDEIDWENFIEEFKDSLNSECSLAR